MLVLMLMLPLLPLLPLLLLLLLHLLLHPRLLLGSFLLELLDELRNRHASLLGVNGQLALHCSNLLGRRHLARRGHGHGHLPGLGRILHFSTLRYNNVETGFLPDGAVDRKMEGNCRKLGRGIWFLVGVSPLGAGMMKPRIDNGDLDSFQPRNLKAVCQLQSHGPSGSCRIGQLKRRCQGRATEDGEERLVLPCGSGAPYQPHFDPRRA